MSPGSGRLFAAAGLLLVSAWYPGDKKAVLEDEAKRATITPPKK